MRAESLHTILVILWLGWLLGSIQLVYIFVGAHAMVAYFPEGRRWWLFPAQLASLAVFGCAAAFHPL